MTEKTARITAKNRSKKIRNQEFFVVYEFGGPDDYNVANENDLETYFDGAQIVACYMDGLEQ
jgi:hypothetical protein